ncbi:hypothetical protein, partial [Streptomyces diastaticus]
MSTDDEDFMAYFIREYDGVEGPWARAELREDFGVSHELLASFRQHLASRASTTKPTAGRTPTPPVPRRRKSRANRRPSTPRGTGGPRTYKVTRTTRNTRTSGTTTVVTEV